MKRSRTERIMISHEELLVILRKAGIQFPEAVMLNALTIKDDKLHEAILTDVVIEWDTEDE